MATTKHAPAEETETPKKHIITFAKDATAEEKMAALEAAKKEIQDAVLEELGAQKKELEAQLEEVSNKINAILPPFEHPAAKHRVSKATKAEGIKVTDKRLTELIKEAGGELSIRGGKGKPAYDLATIKTIVEGSNGKFKIGGKSPWPNVSLA